MRDGHTRTMPTAGEDMISDWFLSRNAARVVVLAGGEAGTEYELSSGRVTLGRGPGVDLAFEDDAMSREHAVLQVGEDGFELVDLDSTNGVQLNGRAVKKAPRKHGDQFQLGEHIFQYLLEEREREPRAYEVPEN